MSSQNDEKEDAPISLLTGLAGFLVYADTVRDRLAEGKKMREHARAGVMENGNHPAQIFGYMGKGETFNESISKFALAYTKQNSQDHDALLKAIKKGNVTATQE